MTHGRFACQRSRRRRRRKLVGQPVVELDAVHQRTAHHAVAAEDGLLRTLWVAHGHSRHAQRRPRERVRQNSHRVHVSEALKVPPNVHRLHTRQQAGHEQPLRVPVLHAARRRGRGATSAPPARRGGRCRSLPPWRRRPAPDRALLTAAPTAAAAAAATTAGPARAGGLGRPLRHQHPHRIRVASPHRTTPVARVDIVRAER
eukprot:CAMPEP_0196790750 /NCGR_PEP_ID=MMETSP1104-20130614/28775_1 /TAXON_ID=33652 /ORGANISM="Cafeteria sp., Strain Caron Lab Isolate" /LENGTH=201 /DNA_ID=CAMNT_0042161117 /DNA_START=6 /DNA_END=608 /DNA_ORIENTATION=+